MTKIRKSYSPEEKVRVIRKHLAEKIPVSDLCDEYGISVNTYYNWQKTFFENGAEAFRGNGKTKIEKKAKRKIAALEEKIQRKNEVLSELMEAHIALKKSLGGI